MPSIMSSKAIDGECVQISALHKISLLPSPSTPQSAQEWTTVSSHAISYQTIALSFANSNNAHQRIRSLSSERLTWTKVCLHCWNTRTKTSNAAPCNRADRDGGVSILLRGLSRFCSCPLHMIKTYTHDMHAPMNRISLLRNMHTWTKVHDVRRPLLNSP